MPLGVAPGGPRQQPELKGGCRQLSTPVGTLKPGAGPVLMMRLPAPWSHHQVWVLGARVEHLEREACSLGGKGFPPLPPERASSVPRLC